MKHSIRISVLMALSGVITPTTATPSEQECSTAISQCKARMLVKFVSLPVGITSLSGSDISPQLSSLWALANNSVANQGGHGGNSIAMSYLRQINTQATNNLSILKQCDSPQKPSEAWIQQNQSAKPSKVVISKKQVWARFCHNKIPEPSHGTGLPEY